VNKIYVIKQKSTNMWKYLQYIKIKNIMKTQMRFYNVSEEPTLLYGRENKERESRIQYGDTNF
jgi:hypothetical protein